MKKRAPAKINLFLRVLGRRPDGYHEVSTIMQTVDLCDEVEIQAAAITSVTFDSEFGEPTRPDLVERAIDAMRSRLPSPQAFEAHVLKRIPMGSGLGGGSSDAAAAITAVNQLTGAPLTAAALADIASAIGADVAFFLQGGTAIARGKGDDVEQLGCPQPLWWVIAMSDEGLSTADVYRRYDEMNSPSGPEKPEKLVEALGAGDVGAIGSCLHNDLEVAAFDLRPELAGLKSDLLALGAAGAVMTGSGAAVVALVTGPEVAGSIAARLEGRVGFVRVAKTGK